MNPERGDTGRAHKQTQWLARYSEGAESTVVGATAQCSLLISVDQYPPVGFWTKLTERACRLTEIVSPCASGD